MPRDVSIAISVENEKEFERALKAAQSAVKVLSSELEASEAAFDNNGDAQERLASKNRILRAQLEQQREVTRALGEAARFAGDEYGDAGYQTDKYRIQLNKAIAAQERMEKALRETQEEAEELGRDSTRIGRQLEDGIGDSADDVSEKLGQMIGTLEADMSGIGSAVTFSAFTDGARGAIDIVTQVIEGIDSIVEGTEDYRRKMSFLEQNAITAGMDPEIIRLMAIEIATLTGEMDGAVEGLSNLMAAGLDEDELALAIERLSGAVIQFPETMKFENLAESLQESIATGSATGAYAELLERLGLDLDTVNKSLEEAETLEARQTVALAWLSEHGLEGTVENYETMNRDLLASEEAQLKYNDALAGLGEALLPTQTAFINFKTAFVQGTTDMINGGFTEFLAGIDEKLKETREALDNWMKELIGSEAYEKLFGGEREPGTAGEYAAGYTGPYLLTQEPSTAASAYAAAAGIGAAYGQRAGTAMAENAQEAVEALEPELEESAAGTGEAMGAGLNDGLSGQIPEITETCYTLHQQAEAILSEEIVIPVSLGRPGWMGAQGNTNIHAESDGGGVVTLQTKVTLEGRTVGRATSDTVNADLGARAQHEAMYR